MQLLCRSPFHRSEFLAAGVGSGEAVRFPVRRSPRFLRVCAGDNKRQPNFIDIGGASRGGWDEVKVVRATQPSESKKGKRFGKKTEPARTPVVNNPHGCKILYACHSEKLFFSA